MSMRKSIKLVMNICTSFRIINAGCCNIQTTKSHWLNTTVLISCTKSHVGLATFTDIWVIFILRLISSLSQDFLQALLREKRNSGNTLDF